MTHALIIMASCIFLCITELFLVILVFICARVLFTPELSVACRRWPFLVLPVGISSQTALCTYVKLNISLWIPIIGQVSRYFNRRFVDVGRRLVCSFASRLARVLDRARQWRTLWNTSTRV